MKITKILAVLLALCSMLTLFAACSSDDGTDMQNGKDQEQKEEQAEQNKNEDKQNGTQAGNDNKDPIVNGGDEKLEYNISDIGQFYDGMALITTNIGYGYINTKGEVVIQPIFDSANDFCNGIACVKKADLYGYINTSGEYIFEPQFEEASAFDKIARVKKNGSVQYINEQGTVLYAPSGNEVAIGDIKNGSFWVETVEELISGNVHTITYYKHNGTKASIANASHTNYKYMYFSTSKAGHEITSLNEYGYAVIQRGTNDRSLIKVENEVEIVIERLYREISNNHRDNYFSDLDTQKSYYIDFLTGEKTEVQLDFLDTIWRNLGNNYYFVDTKRPEYDYELVLLYKDEIVLTFSEIEEFANATPIGVSRCEFGGKNYFAVVLESQSKVKFTALIDENGKVLISPTKEYVFVSEKDEYQYGYNKIYTMTPIVDGIFRAKSATSGLYGYVDLEGNWVIEPKYTSACDFYGKGDDAVAVVNGNTIINKKGETVFSAE